MNLKVTAKNGRRRKGSKRTKSDVIRLNGTSSVLAETNASGTNIFAGVTSFYTFDPVNIGGRVSTAASIFTRFRVLSATVEYVPSVGSTSGGSLALAILDDVGTSAEESGITSYATAIQLRRSVSMTTWRNQTLFYRPVDRNKWYYVTTDSGDSRFEIPFTLVCFGMSLADSTIYGTFVIRYSIEFKGQTAPFTPS